MEHFIQASLMSFGMGMSLGVCSVVGIKNGANNSPIHTYVTLSSAHIVDITMFLLYYVGATFIFEIKAVQIILYLLGIVLLSKIAFNNIKNAKHSLDTEGNRQSLVKSMTDGIIAASIPSSIIFWVATVGTALVGTTDHFPTFLLACSGIILGFQASNLIWVTVVVFINKLANSKLLYWLNILSGVILSGIVISFILQLLEAL